MSTVQRPERFVRRNLTQAVRWGWLAIAGLLLALLTAWGYDAPLPIIGVVLISFPTGLLAAPLTTLVFDFPVSIEGMPFPPPWWIYGLLALVLGYLQWFVLLPALAGKFKTWHQPSDWTDLRLWRGEDAMTKQTARNALLTVGAWSISAIVAMLITLVLIPLNNRLRFSGDSGAVIMWVWFRLPEAITAVAAAVAVPWLVETRRPYAWVAALAALYLYTGVMDAIRTHAGFQSPPTTLDNVGVVIAGLLPTFACAIAAVWYHRRRL